MGPYYLSALVNLIGPAKKVSGNIVKGANKRMILVGSRRNKKFKR